MTRDEFHRLFKTPGPAVTPVIHARDAAQCLRNAAIAARAGAAGVFVINHDFPMAELLPVLREIRAAAPRLWLGANFLGVSGARAFPALAALEAEGCAVDAYWADDARVDERAGTREEAVEIARIRARSGWRGLYFGGVAFKKQRPVDPADFERAARLAAPFMDVVTTSGPATGREADAGKIAAFRRGLGDGPLALASGVTPQNAAAFARDVDCFLVATGISRPGDFHDIDAGLLEELLAVTRESPA